MTSKKNSAQAATSHLASPLPQAPRFIRHQEITRSHNAEKLMRQNIELAGEGRLTHDEEVVLFKRLQYFAYRMSKMWNRVESLSPDEQAQYIKWHQSYQTTRDRLVNANLGLVFDLLGKNRFTNVEIEESRSEGLMALLRAVDTYNPWSGYRFSTYACNAILRAFSRLALHESKRQTLRATRFETHMEPDDWIEQQTEGDLDLLIERMGIVLKEDRAELTDIEQKILQARFPLSTSSKRSTLKTVGARMNISKERVRQIQESALSKLRRALIGDPALQ